MQLTLTDLERAWELKDPALVDYLVALAAESEPSPQQPIRDEALTFKRWLTTILSPAFRQKSPEEQRAYRVMQLTLLEADNAEVPLPERLKLHKLILRLYADEHYHARTVLLEIIRRTPLVYGPWRALKHIFKAAEAQNDYQLLGEISARCDAARGQEFSHPTLIYMRRRAWRYLRKLGQSLPACYPEAAVHYLAAYPDDTDWQATWVANHIWRHQAKKYGLTHFHETGSSNLLKNRAFAETWRRTPEPLLRLLSLARAEKVRQYACEALKQDFKILLRDVAPQWLIELASLPAQSKAVDGFIVWLLQNSPKLEQHQFRSLGLHEVVLALLESADTQAQQYAVQYAKAHARDLALAELLRLASHDSTELVALVQQLIAERDPRTAVGLDAWGHLLEIRQHHAVATAALLKYFGRKELTPNWFQQRLLSPHGLGHQFATQYLLELHPLKELKLDYFHELLTLLDPGIAHAYQVAQFALAQIGQLEVNALPLAFVQTALCNPLLRAQMLAWLESDTYKVKQLPVDFCQALAYEPAWATHPVLQQLRQSALPWARAIAFDKAMAERVRTWLADARRFSPADLGFEWLMTLVNREEAEYHDFAVTLMIKAFVPADFAPKQSVAVVPTGQNAPPIDQTVDLKQQSFLFTGKLQTMVRAAAEAMVTNANGKNAGAVTVKLDYLVIGDDGSPLYGNGRKGSKQLKAEELIAAGAKLKIISETAFLQLLAGEQRSFSSDNILEGCTALWNMAVAKPDTPNSKFAIQYLRHHHPGLCLKLTDRPVDPGAEIPQSFLSFSQVSPLFRHAHPPLRHLALEFAHHEFARWSPTAAELVGLCESRHSDVREFVSKALLAAPEMENKRYRLDVTQWQANAVYSFCEAKTPHTRQLGMQLIQRHTQFQLPEALFPLTESPDRELRGFVVRVLWALYRRYATTPTWKPTLPAMASLSKTDQAKREDALKNLGQGLPKRPANLPADLPSLQQLLRRWLYELPPGPTSTERLDTQHKPLAASVAKKALIETFRDLALDDLEFARLIVPLLRNFTRSRGMMEQAACLVAVTRIHHAHPSLIEV